MHSHKDQYVEPSYACQYSVSTRIGRHAAKLGNQACPLTGLAALHERGRDKGPSFDVPRTSTDKHEGQYDIALSHAHPVKELVGRRRPVVRIKNLGSVGVRCLINSEAL